jgi:hypothetical protein
MSAGSRPTVGSFLFRFALGTVALLPGCYTEPCDCPPGTSSLAFYGQALTATGQPIAAAAITVTLTVPACVFPPAGLPSLAATTGSDGRFRTAAERREAGAEACARVAAHDPSGGTEPIASIEGVRVQFPRAIDGVDSVELVLRAQQ